MAILKTITSRHHCRGASAPGSGSIVLALIGAGTDVDQVDRNGYSALSVAAISGHQGAIEVLLEIVVGKSSLTYDGSTPDRIEKEEPHKKDSLLIYGHKSKHLNNTRILAPFSTMLISYNLTSVPKMTPNE